MVNKNDFFNNEDILNEEFTDSFDFDELEEKLQSQLEEEFADMQFLKEEKEKIGNPDNLGDVIMDVVWEQFLNQVAVTAGEDFIKENRGLHLDLRKKAHIQTTENFEKGKIATHNTEIDYQQRYDDWQKNFVKDKNGNIVTHQTRSGKEEATLVKGVRKPFDKGRPTGSIENHTDMDHTVSAAEIIRDPATNAHMTKEEQIAFANSDANLNEMDSSLNRSKGDKPMKEWLDNPNANGQKPDEIFHISAEDDTKMRQKDDEAREEYEKKKKEAEQKSIEAGKKSRKKEAFRIGGKVLRAVLMQLLAELVREIIAKLVKWFKSSKKVLNTLLENLKKDVQFVALSISNLIRQAGNKIQSSDKFTKNIANNQELWKQELANYPFNDNDVMILDGHFTLLNHSKEIVELPFSTFDGLEISKIILKKEHPVIIRERLEKRDNQYWEQELIESFQDSEENQALEFSRLKNIPIFIYDSDLKLGELKNLLNV